jgi:hypothetical protein
VWTYLYGTFSVNEYFYIEGGSKVSPKKKIVMGQSKRLVVAPKKNYELEKHLGCPPPITTNSYDSH